MYERALTAWLAEQSDLQMTLLTPNDVVTLREFRGVVGSAFETIIGRGLPSPDEIQRTKVDKEEGNGYIYFEDILRLQSQGEEFPVVSLFPTGTEWNGEVVIWVDGAGKRGMFDNSGQPRTEVLRLLDGGLSVLSADLFEQGEFLLSQSVLTEQRVVGNSREFAGYTFAYNDTLFARRVHDILTLISWVRNDDHAPQELHLIGVHGGGPLVAAARAIAGDQIDRAAVDTAGFRFSALRTYRDPNFLPGAVKYGDLPALLALSAPYPLWIGGEQGEVPDLVERAYAAAGDAGAVSSSSLQTTNDAAVEWLLSR